MIKLSFSVSEADGVYTLNLFADINDVKDIFVQNFDLTFSYSDITVDSSKITSDFGIFFSNNIVVSWCNGYGNIVFIHQLHRWIGPVI
jgi:intein-encoded DNA endonuclease-like protein